MSAIYITKEFRKAINNYSAGLDDGKAEKLALDNLYAATSDNSLAKYEGDLKAKIDAVYRLLESNKAEIAEKFSPNARTAFGIFTADVGKLSKAPAAAPTIEIPTAKTPAVPDTPLPDTAPATDTEAAAEEPAPAPAPTAAAEPTTVKTHKVSKAEYKHFGVGAKGEATKDFEKLLSKAGVKGINFDGHLTKDEVTKAQKAGLELVNDDGVQRFNVDAVKGFIKSTGKKDHSDEEKKSKKSSSKDRDHDDKPFISKAFKTLTTVPWKWDFDKSDNPVKATEAGWKQNARGAKARQD